MRMMNRVFGALGIRSIMSNWNADFTGQPRTTGNGEVYAGTGPITFTIKNYWHSQNEKVLSFKTYKYITDEKNGNEKTQPKSLTERYSELFDNQNLKEQPTTKVISNIFSTIDVINFGATVAEAGQNISLTGAVQFSQGANKYKNTDIILHNILSPFRNSNLEDASASTIGTKFFTDEAHYFYSFSINPKEYVKYVDVIENFEGYTVEAYQKFKEAALISATVYKSSSKAGCENEFALFVELKNDSQIYLSNLAQYITFSKKDEKDTIDITGLGFLKEEKIKKEIDKIELYYNPHTTTIKMDIDAIKYNIITREKL